MAFPSQVDDDTGVKDLIDAIPNLKYAMDRFFSDNPRPEREFQQLVARENNFSTISNESEYFIVDIELAGALPNAKFDMLAVRWLSRERARSATLVPTLIEMKYGNNALQGDAGLIKHLKDAYNLRTNAATWQTLLNATEAHLRQLKDLGLIKFNPSRAVPDLLLDRTQVLSLFFSLLIIIQGQR